MARTTRRSRSPRRLTKPIDVEATVTTDVGATTTTVVDLSVLEADDETPNDYLIDTDNDYDGGQLPVPALVVTVSIVVLRSIAALAMRR